jgi:hydrogenase maturation protease
VALGNPLNGDDGFGLRVLQQLQGADDLRPDVTLIDAGTDLLNHIESFFGYDRVVLIDAILDPEGKLASVGSVETVDEESFLSWSGESRSAHLLSPLTAIRLFRTLHPSAKTQILLLGLFVDRIMHSPLYMNDKRIEEAVAVIRFLLK